MAFHVILLHHVYQWLCGIESLNCQQRVHLQLSGVSIEGIWVSGFFFSLLQEMHYVPDYWHCRENASELVERSKRKPIYQTESCSRAPLVHGLIRTPRVKWGTFQSGLQPRGHALNECRLGLWRTHGTWHHSIRKQQHRVGKSRTMQIMIAHKRAHTKSICWDFYNIVVLEKLTDEKLIFRRIWKKRLEV